MEMHSSHVYKGDQLLIIGGRCLPQGGTLDAITFNDIIYQVDTKSGKVSEFGKLPCAVGSHVSCIIDDKYIVVYGGTNGYRFFDNVLRYEISKQKWTLMTKYPDSWKDSKWFSDGRIAVSSWSSDSKGYALFFGGCSAETDHGDFMVLPFAAFKDDSNFSEITEIM